MLLSAKEYERGLIAWTQRDGLFLRVGLRQPDGSIMWSERLPDPEGTIIPFEAETISPRFDVEFHEPMQTRELWVRTERVVRGVLVTRYSHGFGGLQATLRHVPDYGTYHRLVIDASALRWTDDVVFRNQGIVIRFVTGVIECERAAPFSEAKETDTGAMLEGGGQATERLEGRYVDIAVPGQTPEQAELHAYTLVGLLALALGPNAVGRIVSSEKYAAAPDSQRGEVLLPVRARFPRHLGTAEFGVLHRMLDELTIEGRLQRARILALRWYAQTLRAEEPLDAVLAAFTAIDALVSAAAREHGPLQAEIDREAADKPVLDFALTLGTDLFDRVRHRLRGASLTERFVFFVEQFGLPVEAEEAFRKIKKVRDDAVHGDQVFAGAALAADAERLLRRMLKATYRVDGDLPWEGHPSVSELRIQFEFRPRTQIATSGDSEGA